ncbi:MAG: 1-deoxy-D-xylulose-5-phosphate reductoisomerase [Clostridiales bacterium]|nr:1-deoxy-D-xylulose-5-phosphate reductoisomerase [Clostridiales bacterium]
MKKIAILGSTGSIGTQALEVIRNNKDLFQVTALTAGHNIDLIAEQIKEFNPKIAAVSKEEDAIRLKKLFKNTDVLYGIEGIISAAKDSGNDITLNSLVGMIGLVPTHAAIEAGKDIALANKETLVAGGGLIMDLVEKHGVKMIPVDSEHSAIFQCLQGSEHRNIKTLKLTASGGPFRGYSLEMLKQVTLEDALKHPNWSMGNKITVDSATLMNKGLEVIEARWLFDIPAENIEVIVHPQSIIHSMVEFVDGSVLAQLGVPDMKIPIQYALTYPDRIRSGFEKLELTKIGSLTFETPKKTVFKTLQMAYDAVSKGGSYPIVLNAANEVLVRFFLERKIQFLDIQNNILKIMEKHNPIWNLQLDDIIEIDKDIRERVLVECS